VLQEREVEEDYELNKKKRELYIIHVSFYLHAIIKPIVNQELKITNEFNWFQNNLCFLDT
jgi:hypothetical protein